MEKQLTEISKALKTMTGYDSQEDDGEGSTAGMAMGAVL